MPLFNNVLAGAAGQSAGGDAGYKIERSLRFNEADSAYLSANVSTKVTTFTLSFWFKRSTSGTWQYLWAQTDGSGYSGIGLEDSGDRITLYNGGHNYTTGRYRDFSAWYHAHLKVSSGAATLYINGEQVATATGFFLGGGTSKIGDFISSSHKFNGYIADFQCVSGTALDPTSFGKFSAETGVWNPIEYTHSITPTEAISYGVDNTSNVFDGSPGNYDTTGLSFGTWPGTIQNSNVGGYGANSVQVLKTNSGNAVTWTINTGNTNRYIHTSSDGINWTTNLTTISGTAVQVTSAWLGWGGGANADYTTVSVPEDNSFHLDFSDNSSNAALGTDSSGANNTWTINNLSVASGAGNDSLIDTPTNYEATGSGNNGGNYCTMSPIDHHGCTFANGNLEITTNSSKCGRGTFWANSGKWYFEFDMTTYGNPYVGIASNGALQHYVSENSIAANNTGTLYVSTNGTQSYPGNTVRLNAVGSYMVAFDLDNGKIWWGKNGTWYKQHSSANSTTTKAEVEAGNGATEFSSHPSFGDYWTVQFGTSTNTSAYSLNAGQRPFQYPNSIPTGFKSLCTQNLDDPLIAKPSTAFDVELYTSNNASLSVTGYEFSPSFVWIKNRASAQMHGLFDVVRGPNKFISSNRNNAQNTTSGSGFGTGTFNSFDPNGFTLGDDVGQNSTNYPPNQAHVAWAWDGGNLATNSAYDQSKVWSSFWSATGNGIEASNPAANSFDGVLTGLGMRLNASSSCTWAPTGGYSYSGDFLIYACKDNNYTNTSWTVVHAGGTTDITSSVAAGTTMTELNLTNLGIQSPITSISFTSNNNGNPRVAGMKANGKILVDAGLIPVGSLNSSLYNQSATWTGDLTTNGGTSWFGGAAANAFDGSTSTFVQAAIGGDLTFTPTTGISVTSSMRIWADSGSGFGVGNGPYTITYNGTQVYSGSMWSSPYTITAAAGTTFSSLVLAPSGGEAMRLFAVEIDGRLLINSGASVTNVPLNASTVRANPTAGFSIVKYVGDNTLGTSYAHGLNAPPSVIIVKNLDSTDNWAVYHKDMGANKYLQLDTIAAMLGNTGWWNDTDPTSSVFYTGNASTTAGNNQNHIAFCMSPVNGYSAMGSYSGNGTGKFIYTGFKVRFLLTKAYSTNSHNNNNWTIYDSERDSNENESVLYPNSNTFENSHPSLGLDLLSNGFALKSDTSGYSNNNGWDYLFVAFAHSPFKYARAC